MDTGVCSHILLCDIVLSSSSSSHAGEGFLWLQIVKCNFLNWCLMIFSVMSDEKQTQTTLPGMKNGYWYLFTHTIVRHCFILLIRQPTAATFPAGEGFLYLQILKCSFLNWGLMIFSVMSDEKQTNSIFPGVKNGYWCLFTHTIVRHCFILLIIFPRWGRLFVTANC